MGMKNSNSGFTYVAALIVGLTIYSIGAMCYAKLTPAIPCQKIITSIAIDPDHPDTVYFSRAHNGGGVYKTTDGGASWRKVYKKMYIEGPMTIDTKTSNVVYAGYIRSTDSGENWNDMGNSRLIIPPIHELVINPHNPAMLYAAALRGLFWSTDSGKTWMAISDEKLGACRAFAMDTSNPKVLYAYFGKEKRDNGYISGTIGGIYKSIDGGANWNSILPATDIVKLIVDPSNSAIIYAGTIEQGVYRSVDGGKQWGTVNRGLPAGRQVSDLVIDPINPKMIYAGTFSGVFISTDRGDNWYNSSTGIPNSTGVLSLAVNPKKPNIIYAGTTSSGIYKSIEGGENWKPVNAGIPCDDYESSW